MKTITCDFDTQRPVALWLLSDLHLGHAAHDAALFQRHKELAKRARAKVLFLGDALEAVNTSSGVCQVGGHFEQTGTIGQQRKMFEDAVSGLRTIAIVDGNHERRLVKDQGDSPLEVAAENIARQQKWPCEYHPHGVFVEVCVGIQIYTLVIHHGEGGGATFFKNLARDYQGADLYAAGHSHALMQEETFVHTKEGLKRVVNVRTGSYLHLPSYAWNKPGSGGVPATGSWLLWLYPDDKRMRLEKLEDRSLAAA